MKLKKAYDDFGPASVETGLACLDASLAVQSMAEETDINTIVKRFGLTGQLPSDVRVPTFGDFTEVTDFQTAMNAVLDAEKSFMAMPAEVRKRFGNDPQEFVMFCSDEKNVDEMRKLGLAVPKVEPVKDERAEMDKLLLAELKRVKPSEEPGGTRR